jgi:hypothetical protein
MRNFILSGLTGLAIACAAPAFAAPVSTAVSGLASGAGDSITHVQMMDKPMMHKHMMHKHKMMMMHKHHMHHHMMHKKMM